MNHFNIQSTHSNSGSNNCRLYQDTGTSSHNTSLHDVDPALTASLVPVSSENVLDRYREIQLPSCDLSRQRGSSVRNLTHPSQLGKRAVKSGRRTVGGDKVLRKRKRKFDDQPDVFDHLATLRKKLNAQIEQRDSQEVPVSPQFQFASGDLSLHSSSLSPQPTTIYHSNPTQPKAKRVLFASEFSHSDKDYSDNEILYVDPPPTHSPQLTYVKEEEGEQVLSEADTSFTVPSLDHAPAHEGYLQIAEVPSPSSILRPYVTSPVGPGGLGAGASVGGCADPDPLNFNILNYFPREE